MDLPRNFKLDQAFSQIVGYDYNHGPRYFLAGVASTLTLLSQQNQVFPTEVCFAC